MSLDAAPITIAVRVVFTVHAFTFSELSKGDVKNIPSVLFVLIKVHLRGGLPADVIEV
ncbi:MAG: hypothetical protein ACI8XX_000047 [Polaribacter sp.]